MRLERNPKRNNEFIRSAFEVCGKCPPVTIVIQASLSLQCALRVKGRETCTDTVSQRSVWLRGPLIITDRATHRRTDRLHRRGRRQAPALGAGPTNTKRRRGGGQRARPRGDGGKNQSSPIRCGASAPTVC